MISAVVVRGARDRSADTAGNGTSAGGGRTPTLFALVSAILFQQRLKQRRRNRAKSSPEVFPVASSPPKTVARKKFSISLKHSQSLPLIRPKASLRQKQSMVAAVETKKMTEQQHK
uniref:Uncharacterized protein n=1 Tax=Globodera rostochiensis TaxID=31243 RepID=A0A914GXJ2_GLORO